MVFRQFFPEIPTTSEFHRNSDRKVQLRPVALEHVQLDNQIMEKLQIEKSLALSSVIGHV